MWWLTSIVFGGLLFFVFLYIFMKLFDLVLGCIVLNLKVLFCGYDSVFPDDSPATPDTAEAFQPRTPGHHYLSPPIPLETSQEPHPD